VSISVEVAAKLLKKMSGSEEATGVGNRLKVSMKNEMAAKKMTS
jgi:hypothetical protein